MIGPDPPQRPEMLRLMFLGNFTFVRQTSIQISTYELSYLELLHTYLN